MFTTKLTRPPFTKAVDHDITLLSDEGLFEGYAAIFHEEDLSHDVIAPGAFAETLRAKRPSDIRMLYQHNPNEPIGVWQELYEDHIGLFARGRLLLDVARGREAAAMMKAGAIDGLSIGFHTVKGHTDPHSGVRMLYDIDLWEISIVTFPVHPHARVDTIKNDRGLLTTIQNAAHVLRRSV